MCMPFERLNCNVFSAVSYSEHQKNGATTNERVCLRVDVIRIWLGEIKHIPMSSSPEKGRVGRVLDTIKHLGFCFCSHVITYCYFVRSQWGKAFRAVRVESFLWISLLPIPQYSRSRTTSEVRSAKTRSVTGRNHQPQQS